MEKVVLMIGKTALLIEGARRVGKSAVVKNFTYKNEYATYILLIFDSFQIL